MVPLDALAARWPEISALLDQVLELPAAERQRWLESLSGPQGEFADVLRRLVDMQARLETDDYLVTLPRLSHTPPSIASDAGLVAGETIGPYRLVAELGHGGMGAVWRATRQHGSFEREVALKLPLVNRLRRDLALRFARERDILARLEHPHIARLYDAGVTADGLPYLAMEFVDGEPIGSWCDGRRLDVPARLELFGQVLDAVQFAHASLVIHRDLKPANILVDGQGQARLLDFGIAKLLADDATAPETQLTQQVGRALTPDYASPEQIRGEPLTIASDIYSLGVVLCELLCGRRPYRLEIRSAAQLEQAIVSAEPAQPSRLVDAAAAQARGTSAARLARALAGDLDTIVGKALAKAPSQRYATAAEFAEDLRRYTSGEPVRARPASLAYRTRKFIARNRIVVGAATAIGVTLLAATAVSLHQARLATTQALRAEEVKKFVVAIFEAADIGGGGDRQTTGVELLRQARERLDQAAIADDAIRVELLTTIGTGLHGFGERQLSEPAIAEAVRIARASLPDTHPIAAGAHLMYAYVLMEKGEGKLAAPHFDAAEEGYRRSGDQAQLASALRGKAVLHLGEGRPDSAIELARQAVRAAESQAPPVDRRAMVETHLILTSVLISTQQPGVLEQAQRTYTLAREYFGQRVTNLLLLTRRNYAFALADEGDPALAATELREILRQQTEMFGPQHASVGRTLSVMGVLSMRTGDAHAAIESFGRTLRIFTPLSDGKPTQATVRARLSLGKALAAARHDEQALAEFRQAGRDIVAQNPDNAQARQAESLVATMLIRLGRLGEADTLLTALAERPFASPADAALVKGPLGMLRSAQGRHAEAQVLLRDAAAALTDKASEPSRAQWLAELGKALVDGAQAQEALAVLQQSRTLLLGAQRNGSPDLANLSIDLARAQLALGRVDAAMAAAADATAFWDTFEPASRGAGIARLWHARALLAAGRVSEANDALKRADAVLRSAGLPADRALVDRSRGEVTMAGR